MQPRYGFQPRRVTAEEAERKDLVLESRRIEAPGQIGDEPLQAPGL